MLNESSKRLLKTMEFVEGSGRRVKAIYAVGTSVAKKIVHATDFGSRNIKIVMSKHPTSVLHDTSDAYDSKTRTFEFFETQNYSHTQFQLSLHARNN